jgi:hypothetical protein
MKTKEKKAPLVPVRAIAVGDCFVHHELGICMKCETIANNVFAVNLRDGKVREYYPSLMVHPVDAEMHWEEKR